MEGLSFKTSLLYCLNTPAALSQPPSAPRGSCDLSSASSDPGAPLEENAEDTESLQPETREQLYLKEHEWG